MPGFEIVDYDNVPALEQALVHLDDNLNTRLQAEVLLLDWPRVPVEALP